MMKTSKWDIFSFSLLRFLEKERRWIITLFSGFLLGRVTNEFSTTGATISSVIDGTFSITKRPANVLSWLSLIIILIIPVLQRIMRRYHHKKQYTQIFMNILKKHRSRTIAPFPGLGWDEALSLQTCPQLNQGWPISQIKVQHSTTKFSIQPEYEKPYKEYFSKNYQKKRFFDDGDKIMLARNPAAFTDSPTLVLHTKEAKYSEIQFFKDNVSILTDKRNEFIGKAINGTIAFPNAFCMQLVVETNDEKVLLTKRSPKVIYFPETWACSVAEQATANDFENKSDLILVRWAERLLDEELGIHAGDYDPMNFRVLSAFLEADILNTALCAHLVLNLSSAELQQRLVILPRKDYEFNEWEFVTYTQLLDELFQPTREYHPSTGYCMLIGLIKKFGEPAMAQKLLHFT